MGQINSYFQLDVRNEGIYIKVFPAQNGGTPISIGEITAYLSNQNLNTYDLKELNRMLFLDRESELRVGDSKGIPISESMDMKIAADDMLVVCRFYPPSKGGAVVTTQEIVKDLQFRGINFGIQQEEIIRFIQERCYCTDYILAKGIPPVHGTDAQIEYYFNTDVNLKPKKNEDGSVNYRELDMISHVKAGDLLAKLVKEDLGTPGKDVFGHDIKPRTVKSLRLSFANNITLSEDQTEIYSNVTGHVSLVNGKVFVSDIYEVPADVDNSVGNISYQGNVHIAGNVKDGFSVYAKGDIIVDGIIEGAVLQSEGQIIVKRGIHGMSHGMVKAQGNVICKFIENATVVAGGYIETESIILSQVSAASEVRVEGGKGFIMGGTVRAGGTVEALTIGSERGAVTKIEVGIEPEKKERYIELQKMMQKANKEISQIQPILTSYKEKLAKGELITQDKIQYIRQLVVGMQERQSAIDLAQNEYLQLHTAMMSEKGSKVKVKKDIYPGVTVGISDLSITIYEKRSFCQLLKEQGEIVIRNL